jgi:hypothetical protein
LRGDGQAAINKGLTDKLEYRIMHNSTATDSAGKSYQATAAKCTVTSVDTAGVGTYSCDVSYNDGSFHN